jgi:hypothetical protein
MKKNKNVIKKEVNMEEITQKLIKLRDELDDYYNNVFIPEYRDKKVFGRVVPKKFSRKTGGSSLFPVGRGDLTGGG